MKEVRTAGLWVKTSHCRFQAAGENAHSLLTPQPIRLLQRKEPGRSPAGFSSKAVQEPRCCRPPRRPRLKAQELVAEEGLRQASQGPAEGYLCRPSSSEQNQPLIHADGALSPSPFGSSRVQRSVALGAPRWAPPVEALKGASAPVPELHPCTAPRCSHQRQPLRPIGLCILPVILRPTPHPTPAE